MSDDEELKVHRLPEGCMRILDHARRLDAVHLERVCALVEGLVELLVPREAIEHSVDGVVCNSTRHGDTMCASEIPLQAFRMKCPREHVGD